MLRGGELGCGVVCCVEERSVGVHSEDDVIIVVRSKEVRWWCDCAETYRTPCNPTDDTAHAPLLLC